LPGSASVFVRVRAPFSVGTGERLANEMRYKSTACSCRSSTRPPRRERPPLGRAWDATRATRQGLGVGSSDVVRDPCGS
jgi:hypothetical protein